MENIRSYWQQYDKAGTEVEKDAGDDEEKNL